MMRKWVSYSFIILATVILIGHSLVPHVHHNFDELTIISKTQRVKSPIGFLGRFFALDTGEEHLEHYQPIIPYKFQITSDDNTQGSEHQISIVVNIFFSADQFIQAVSENTQSALFWYDRPQIRHASSLISNSPLRAPPHC